MPVTISGCGPTRGTQHGAGVVDVAMIAADHRQEREAGLDRRVAERLLQVEGQEQEDAEHPDGRDAAWPGRRRRGSRSSTIRSGSSGCATRRWMTHEATSSDDARGEEAERASRRSSRGLGVGEAVDEREQAGRGGQRARDVELRAGAGTRCSCSSSERADRGRDAKSRFTYRHQRQERYSVSTPPSSRPIGGAAAGDRAEDAERLAALLRVGERGGQQRQRGGSEQRAEDALHGARGDQHAEAVGGAAERGGDGEADQADDEGPLAAEEVADAGRRAAAGCRTRARRR